MLATHQYKIHLYCIITQEIGYWCGASLMKASAKIIICVLSVLSFRRSGRSKRQPPFQMQRLPDVTSEHRHPVTLRPDAIPTSIPISPAF